MAELSTISGVPTATIKYYQREGLLPAAVKSGPNQADYDETHVRRLALIRGLIEVGKLSVAAARTVIEGIDSDAPIIHIFAAAQATISEEIDPDSLDQSSLDRIDTLLEGWRVSPENPGRLAAARVAQVFDDVGQVDAAGWFARYAEAAMLLADADLNEIDERVGRDSKAETVVVGTALGDALIAALRRAAQEHISSERYPGPPLPASSETSSTSDQE